MPAMTYFVVQPFTRSGRGRWLREDAREAPNADAARKSARRLSAKGGAIAFSRSGDPDTGDFADAIILDVFGEVPAEALSMEG